MGGAFKGLKNLSFEKERFLRISKETSLPKTIVFGEKSFDSQPKTTVFGIGFSFWILKPFSFFEKKKV